MDNSTVKQSGSLKISNEVVVKIAQLAANEVEGVSINENKFSARKGILGIVKNLSSPIRVTYSKEAVAIDISIAIKQGYKALKVSSEVQKNVKSSVQNMAHIPVSKVNVKVCGVVTEEEKEEA